MTNRILLCLFLLLLFGNSVSLHAANRREIQAIIASYEEGELERCNSLVMQSQPENSEERAIVLYYKAMLYTEVDSVKIYLKKLTKTLLKTTYGQKALFELGSLSLLERDYNQALDYFNQITDPDLAEKHYWIANTNFQKGEYSQAISSCNQFIRLSRTNTKLEDAYHLTADSYISLNQFNNAITTLKKLLTQPKLIEDEQYLRYRYGYASEMLGNRAEALSQYKLGYECNRFSQLAYLIEDRLFEMRAQNGSNIDLSFLYPQSDMPLPGVVLAEQNKNNNGNDPEKPETNGVINPDNSTAQSDSIQSGLYLQAGRFSLQVNADRMQERIKNLGLKVRIEKSTQFKDISWVVIVGPYQTQLDAVTNKQLLKDNEIESFIIQR